MILLLKLSLISIFILIFFQDYKDRLVYWFFYPLAGINSFIIYSLQIHYISALLNSAMNMTIVIVMLLASYFYSTVVMKKKFVDGSMGMGDIFLLMAISFTFSTISFIVILVFSLIFSLTLHVFLKHNSIHNTVPLAGYISLFFAAVYITSLFIEPKYLFAY